MKLHGNVPCRMVKPNCSQDGIAVNPKQTIFFQFGHSVKDVPPIFFSKVSSTGNAPAFFFSFWPDFEKKFLKNCLANYLILDREIFVRFVRIFEFFSGVP